MKIWFIANIVFWGLGGLWVQQTGFHSWAFGRKEPVTWIGVLPPPGCLLCYSAIGEASWEVWRLLLTNGCQLEGRRRCLPWDPLLSGGT